MAGVGVRLVACCAALLVLLSCAGPDVSVAPGREAVRVAAVPPLRALEAEMAAGVPADLRPQERALFVRRGAGGAVWSASPLSRFDLTGVSWEGGRAALVTDRHVVFSAHTPTPRKGGTLTFYDRDGWPVTRRVTATAALPRLRGADLDAVVGLLDAPVTAGVAVYALPDGGALGDLAAARPPVLVTFARGGRKPTGEVGWGAFATAATLARVSAGGARVVYAEREALRHPSARHDAMWGDSGSPSFLATEDGLLLLSHYHTSEGAGAGPNYADPRVQGLLEDAIERLGAAEAP